MIKKEDREIFEKVTKTLEIQRALSSGIIAESTLKQYGLTLDTKVYMVYWEDYIHQYNFKYGRNLRKYITIQDLLKPRNIIQILYKNTILHYIVTKQQCFYCDAESADNLDRYIMYNALNDILDLKTVRKSLERYCAEKKLNTQSIVLNSEERQFLSCNKTYAMWAIRYFIEESFSFIKYIQSLKHPVNIDITAITSNLNKAFRLDDDSFLIEVDEDNHKNRIMVRWQYLALQEAKDIISWLMVRDAIKLYTGLGGTGKSYDALSYAKTISKNWTCITLCNKIALKLSMDAKQRGFDCIPQSIASYKCDTLRKKGHTEFKYIIIDEFSQWSLNELNTFLQILREVRASNGHIILLGDTHQIPSFLGRGCLLYPIQCYLENTKSHIHKAEIVRQQDTQFKECIMNYVETGCISAFDKYRINNIEEYVEPMYTTFVTGSQYHVEKLNLWALSYILKEYGVSCDPLTVVKKTETKIVYQYKGNTLTNKEDWRTLNSKKLEILDACVKRGIYIKVISKETWIIDKDAYKQADGLKMHDYKVLTNDTGEVIYYEYNRVYIKLDRTDSQGKQICLDVVAGDFFNKFDFGYAINVNKSQGLDWDNVVVYLDFTSGYGCDGNAKNYEAFYVAATRGKLKTVFYIKGDDNLQPFEPQVVANHFNIKESDKKVKSDI